MIDNTASVFFFPLVTACAYVLDILLGDPEWMPHPVRWMGRLIALVERALRRCVSTPLGERLGGIFMTVACVGVTAVSSSVVLYLAHIPSSVLFLIVAVYLVWTTVSIRSLEVEARNIRRSLEGGDVRRARCLLSRIVGRDTETLDKSAIARATVESVSENTSDGIVAPLFYLSLGGPVLALAYKAVNTLDSMVGYRNDRYLNMGWFPARLDDAANFLPARITALLMILAAFFLGLDWRGAWRTVKRDGRKHPSPNAGLPQAALAGALGLRLVGPMSYGGIPHEKPYIGEGRSEAGCADVDSTLRIMRLTTVFMLFISLLVQGLAAAVILA